MADLLVVVNDVADVVAAAVVRFSDGHRFVCEVHIAVFAEEAWHIGGEKGSFVVVRLLSEGVKR
jgi:hypothetical protein